MSNAEPAVARLVGVRHRYRDAIAVDDLNLEIPAGRLAGFIGPDGVGKSTILALVSGVRRIQTGKVEVLGGNMANRRMRNELCARIAYMPQGLGKNLYPTLSIEENIDFFGRMFGQPQKERAARISALLSSTGLAAFRDRPVGKLSGGMKQKLGLCCLLMHDPDLLILDEPTTGVDPLSRRQFWNLIDRLRSGRPKLSVLAATAYMEEADRFDWLCAMETGKLLATGSPSELLSRFNADSLEEAFITMLPEERRAGRRTLVIPPRQASDHETAIEARDLTRRFGDFTAVDHVNFYIERGEIFAFIGSNGCGKTTTMKMLTGLLPTSEGEARLFGRDPSESDLETRSRIGFMSQSFSLYNELTVHQNLDLHARLFHVPQEKIRDRAAEMAMQFGLTPFLHKFPAALPLGIRQRLSLAVAMIHKPELLILDEPTSGVDPIARDSFWQLLVDLSRDEGVTIFLSTHFMNEAERCDRVALMHAGKLLAQGAPRELSASRGVHSLEDAFIAYLSDFAATGDANVTATLQSPAEHTNRGVAARGTTFSGERLWAYARREILELVRDPIRLTFALFVPALLMLAIGYGVSFDVEHVSFAALDRDESPESRTYLDNFSGSRYFDEHRSIRDYSDLDRRLARGEIRVAIEIPPDFGRDLKSGKRPEIAVWLDGSMPFQAETVRWYVEGINQLYLNDLSEHQQDFANDHQIPADIETRFRYNQDFDSAVAMIPGDIMLLLILIPAMMTALGVVREKELGSITNFYATPVTKLEFLLAKQLPYLGIAFIEFGSLVALAVLLFGVPVKGNAAALVGGALLYIMASASLGLLVSTFVRTQIAAIIGATIIAVMPAVQFSGWFTPVSSLTGSAWLMGLAFPSTYFQHIILGTFTKALDFPSLGLDFAALVGFVGIFLISSLILLDKQER
jgi:ribosome-dependent ATPase